MSMLAVIQGLAPIAAPIAGDLLMKITNWQGLFVFLLVLGIFIFAVSLLFKESHAESNRLAEPVWQTFRHFKPILKNKMFIYYTLALGFTMGEISASPFIFQEVFQLSPLQYSIVFGVNAVGFIIGSQLIRLFESSQQALKVGTVGFILITIALALLLNVSAGVYFTEVFFFLLIASVGMIIPILTTYALDLERKTAGNASAILGCAQFLFGCLFSPLVGLVTVTVSTGLVLVFCSISYGILVLKTMKKSSKTENLCYQPIDK